jgi:hypothetical protein
MASSYNNLGIELQATGENAGTWGTKTNTNLNLIAETWGYISIDMAGADVTLAMTSGSSSNARNYILELTGTLAANRTLDIPAQAGSPAANIEKAFIIVDKTNRSGSAYSLTFKVTGATGVTLRALPADKSSAPVTTFVYDNGTDIIDASKDVALSFTDGQYIADNSGNEILSFGVVSSALNEVKITNAATGTAGPIIASQGQTNSNLQLRPAGTGKITAGTTAAHATISSNGAYNLILETNEGTNSGNITIEDGADGDISFTNNGAGNIVFNDAAYNPETGLTDAATITWDSQAMPVTKVTLTDNRILAAPSNGAAGQFISLLIIQDATGSRTLTWNAVFEFPAETAPTLTTTAALGDLFVFRYHNSKWLQVGSTLALTVA